MSSSEDNSDNDSIASVLEEENSQVKRVLVTGGAGFIGSHVAAHLLQRGDYVIIVDEMNDYYDVRLKQANLDYLTETFGEAVTIYKGDICDLDLMANIFDTERPTHICHLAARAGVRPSIVDPYIYVHSNVEGTTRLLDLARQHACKNFVYASSSSVYGCSTNEVLSESDIVEKPVSPYAATKKACELFAYTFYHLYGLNCTGLRFFTVYGPRGRPDMAPFKFIERVYNGVAIQQYGDGSTSRDYTYIDDIVDGVVAAIDKPLGCEVINLGNGRPFLLKDFISLVEKSVGKEAKIEVLPHQPGDVDRTCADITKARELLGYNPKVPFEEGIRRTAEWFRDATEAGLFDEPLPEATTNEASLSDRSRACSLISLQSGVSDDSAPNTPGGVGALDHEALAAEAVGYPLDGERTPPRQGIAEIVSPPRRTYHRGSSTLAYNHKRHLFIHKVSSDLELSSYVQKAPVQVTQRKTRIF